jgi:chaperone required for assembly of F1-ATPase
LARRFYKTVEVGPAQGGLGVLLDGRPLRTPAKRPLALPAEALARGIAAEWDAQVEELRPAAMPLTQIACTALDLLAEAPARARAIEELVDFAATDLLCYRVEEPEDLAARQAAVWQPLLDWLALTYDAPLRVTTGIAAVEQSETALAALGRALAGYDALRLSALATAVRAAGSLVIGLALSEGRIDARQAFEAGELDETYNIERWGEDSLALERRAGLQADLLAARRFLDLLRA